MKNKTKKIYKTPEHPVLHEAWQVEIDQIGTFRTTSFGTYVYQGAPKGIPLWKKLEKVSEEDARRYLDTKVYPKQ